MIKIMFVCHGNICRSPMAECIMKHLIEKENLQDQIQVYSSATSTEEIGNSMYPPARRQLMKHNIEPGNHRAVQLTYEDGMVYDLFVGMDGQNIRNMQKILTNEKKIQKLFPDKDVSDPWYTGDFEQTYEDILEGCQKLLNSTKNLLKN